MIMWKNATLIEGENSILQIPDLIKEHSFSKLLVVTDKNITSLGLTKNLLQELDKARIKFTVCNDTVPNPTIDNIEDALQIYKRNNCQAIIAFGGGSSMDCAKGVAARVSRQNLPVPQFHGLMKVLKPIPIIIAIPTTAGTGSETTIAAVISNPRTHEKHAINDPFLVLKYAVLDPLITIG
jgi:alcohol dehydrogenase